MFSGFNKTTPLSPTVTCCDCCWRLCSPRRRQTFPFPHPQAPCTALPSAFRLCTPQNHPRGTLSLSPKSRGHRFTLPVPPWRHFSRAAHFLLSEGARLLTPLIPHLLAASLSSCSQTSVSARCWGIQGSSHTFSPGDLIQDNGFKYYLYKSDFQSLASTFHISNEYKTMVTNGFLDLSTWMSPCNL